MTKTPKKTKAATPAKPKRDDPNARVSVTKPGDRIVDDPVGGTTQSQETIPGAPVVEGLDPATPPTAN